MNRIEAERNYYAGRGYTAGLIDGVNNNVWSIIEPPRGSSARAWAAWDVGYAAGVEVAEADDCE